jgi:hypothetical protein
MAGTLVITTLSDGTNSTSATNPIRGSARAWVQYNGSAQTITSSFNVSSVTRNTTGQYSIAFTTAMPAATYSIVGCAANTLGDYARYIAAPYSTYSTTGFGFTTANPSSNSQADSGYISLAVFSS